MSWSPTSRSPDIARLAAEGHDLDVRAGTLFVRRIPYVAPSGEVMEGTLAFHIALRGGVATPPSGHAAAWIGETPCDARGRPLRDLVALVGGVVGVRAHGATHLLCSQAPGREFADYHELVTAYALLLGTHAEAVAPGCTARFLRVDRRVDAAGRANDGAAWTGPRRRTAADGCFRYADPAATRSAAAGLDRRLPAVVGIVGLGGTGSHVLDLVAKASVREIHLYDDDVFDEGSAFRCPGSFSVEDATAGRRKVDVLARRCGAMRTGVIPHAVRVGPGDGHLLDGLGFCFVCVDDGAARAVVLDLLEEREVPWIDVGMGLAVTPGGIVGALRTTTGRPGRYAEARARVPSGPAAPDDYATNVQTCDLNALNAALAVVQWKRLFGVHAADRLPMNETFGVDGGHLSEEGAA